MTPLTEIFRRLHQPGTPLILNNIWDVGSAVAVARGGARVLATSSWAVAAARGLPDGEAVTLDVLEDLTRSLRAATTLPISIDVETGYGATPDEVAAAVSRIERAGASGINLEDQIIGGAGLRDIDAQAARIRAIRGAGTALFVNARTDAMLQAASDRPQAERLPEVIARGQAYAAAGADGFFVPGLVAADLVAQVCAAVPLPINIMVTDAQVDLAPFQAAGVARISRGPGSYLAAMATLAIMENRG